MPRQSLALAQASLQFASPGPITIRGIAVPPSLNNLFANVAGRGRVKSEHYRKWRSAVEWDVKRQTNGRGIRGPVKISCLFDESATKADLDNLSKGSIDMLVDLKVIDGDDQKIVRQIVLGWTSEPGMTIRIEAAP